ncbi:hypothetical protein OCGS_2663 [Oceaniovalibus guishaninsula JLT2003]|uniref:Uncharacterized protein n=1 Tax=Oceaniovalibus guishaninsula JLT2003 TaxID=1231392 RepID=K2H8Z8_9RHOB|nr:hypothetical protein OCGS_2663 [Oceaniovalibus guishaninsula JLT2003]
MATFSKGKSASWNPKAGRVGGPVRRVCAQGFGPKGRTRNPTTDDPQSGRVGGTAGHGAAHRQGAPTEAG